MDRNKRASVYDPRDPFDAETGMQSEEEGAEQDAGKPIRSIDEAASPSSQNSPEDPGKPVGSIDYANFGGINNLVNVSYEAQCPGSTCEFTDAFYNDDAAQYMKADKTEINRIRNQAFEMVGETQDNTKPPFTGRQDSDPKGG